MASKIIQVADAVVATMNAAVSGTFDEAFTAVRMYDATQELPAGVDLSVVVMPKGIEYPQAERRRSHKRITVDVAVRQRLPQGTDPRDADANAAIDDLMALAEQVADFWTPGMQAGAGLDAALVAKESPAIWIPEHMANLNTFTSVFTLTFLTT